tara:strand:- start:19402 stop:20232 length:831 start_codon:yes stop_codon:yes gene_type:complete
MDQYLNLLRGVLNDGSKKDDRTGTGTISVFGTQTKYDLTKGFPLVTTKKMHLKSIIHELLWIISGDTNIKYLQDNKVRIWNEWANENGDLGPVYGKQLRAFGKMDDLGLTLKGDTISMPGVDQISEVIKNIKENPLSRRHIVSAWNPIDLPRMALPPCHMIFQFYVNGGELSCQMYQRSADLFLGVPFNIASYALLTMMVAQVCGLKVKEFVHTIGDAHIYMNHVDQVKLQLNREPKPLPKMLINPDVKNIDSFKYEDFTLEEYEYHPRISAKVAV